MSPLPERVSRSQISFRNVSGSAGLLAVVFHTGTVLMIGSQDPRFWSSHHAISDMGVSGAPHSTAMNFGGFIIPGVLFIALAAGVRGWLGSESQFGSVLLGLGGASFAAAGIFPFPGRFHLPAVFVATVGFTLALWLMGPAMGQRRHLSWVSPVSRLVGLSIIGNIFLTTGIIPVPGYYQKASLAVAMIWLATTAYWVSSSGASEA